MTLEKITEQLKQLSTAVEEHLKAKEKEAEMFLAGVPEELEYDIECLENVRDSIDYAVQEMPA